MSFPGIGLAYDRGIEISKKLDEFSIIGLALDPEN